MTIGSAADSRSVLGRADRMPARRTGAVARGQLEALAAVVEDLAGQFDLRPLLERILGHATELLGCDSGSISSMVTEAVNTAKAAGATSILIRGDSADGTGRVVNPLRASGTPMNSAHAVARGVTLRRRLVNVPARIAPTPGQTILHCPRTGPTPRNGPTGDGPSPHSNDKASSEKAHHTGAGNYQQATRNSRAGPQRTPSKSAPEIGAKLPYSECPSTENAPEYCR